MAERVSVGREGPVATVQWDRPPLNVFDIDLLRAVAAALRTDAVRSAPVTLLSGARGRWSAGFSVEDHAADRVPDMFRAFRDLLAAFGEVPGPVVAKVAGPCLGGGLEILSACDLAYAAASATFGQPEIRLGVFPPLAAVTLPAAIGPKRAAALLYLGETIGAARAEELGLVSEVVPDAALDAHLETVTLRLGRMRPEALRLLKVSIEAGRVPTDPGLERAERVYLDQLLRLPEADEGLRAFLAKRPPVWPQPSGA